jgi:hypothetical protein
MNTRKEYPTFEELWTCYAQEESRISAKEKPQKKYDNQAFTARFKNFRNKRKFGSRRKPNQEKDILEVQCFNCRKYGHYKNHCPELKKRKEKHEHQLPKKRNLQRRLSRMKETSSSKVTILLLFLVHILFASSLYISCISISWKIMCSKKNYINGRTTR